MFVLWPNKSDGCGMNERRSTTEYHFEWGESGKYMAKLFFRVLWEIREIFSAVIK